jgi:hypothetical protein
VIDMEHAAKAQKEAAKAAAKAQRREIAAAKKQQARKADAVGDADAYSGEVPRPVKKLSTPMNVGVSSSSTVATETVTSPLPSSIPARTTRPWKRRGRRGGNRGTKHKKKEGGVDVPNLIQ